MCYQKKIYGMPYEFYGFVGVEAYLPPGGEITTLNPALDRWFRYFQAPAVASQVEKVLVINPYVESAKKVVLDRNDPAEMEMLHAMVAKRETNTVLGQQGNQIILMDYDKVKEQAEAAGREVFLSVLLHESTHLLEQYLAENFGIYNKLRSDKRAAYHAEVLISTEEGPEFAYLNQIAAYQRSDMEGEALTCLVEALTLYRNEERKRALIEKLQAKLNAAIEIAQNGGVLL